LVFLIIGTIIIIVVTAFATSFAFKHD